MSLDLFQNDQRDALADASRALAPSFPATFSESFDAAWRHGMMFGQSVSGTNARQEALGDYIDDVVRKSGQRIEYPFQNNLPGTEAVPGQFFPDLDSLNKQVEAIKASDPTLDIAPISEDELQQRALAKSREAVVAYREISEREKGPGGSLGLLLGNVAVGATDPINLVALPVAAPVSLGIVGSALAWAAIAGGTQTAIEFVASPYREKVQPGYSESGEALANIAGAAVTGGVLGGGLKAVAAGWRAVRGGMWPQSVREAGHIVDSEAQIAETNPFTGADGEAAHRAALDKAIDDIANGRDVDVDRIVGGLTPREQPNLGAEIQTDLPLRRAAPEPGAQAALADDLAPSRIEELRADSNGEVADTVARDFDRLRVERGAMEVPVGETIDASGQRVAVTRKIEDIAADVERREAAAKEIAACVGPYQAEGG